MRYIPLVIIFLLQISCSTEPRFTGQWYVEDSPSFYMSIAPTFGNPFDFEIQDEELEYREYSGFGGYDWGSSKVVATVKTTREERNIIDALSKEAIADTIAIYKRRLENDELVVVADGTSWYIQSGVSPFVSIRTNQPDSKAFEELLDLLNSIVTRGASGA